MISSPHLDHSEEEFSNLETEFQRIIAKLENKCPICKQSNCEHEFEIYKLCCDLYLTINTITYILLFTTDVNEIKFSDSLEEFQLPISMLELESKDLINKLKLYLTFF